jgi:aminopeptidase N
MNPFLTFFSLLLVANVEAQQTEYVDFISATANIVFGDVSKNEVGGIISYEFDILKNTDSMYVDANGFHEIEYILDGKEIGELYD